MAMWIIRLLMFAGALLLGADTLMPRRTELGRVDGHVAVSHGRRPDDFDLRFAGGPVQSCEVGRAAFDALKDGDDVALTATSLFHRCDAIARGDQVVMASGALATWLALLVVALMLATAFGWIVPRFGDDEDDEHGGSWGWRPW